MFKKAKEYQVNNFKLAASLIVLFVLYFIVFTILAIEVIMQGYSIAVLNMMFYIGFVLLLIGCVLFAVERREG